MDTVNPETIASNPGAIDVLAFLEQTNYPTREVVVFSDAKSADEYVQLKTLLDPAGKDAEPVEPTAEQEAELERLAAAVRKSSLIFSLRGMAPGVVNEIYGDAPKDDAESVLKENKLIAATVIGAKNSEGIADPRTWAIDDIDKLRRYLKEGEFGKLVKATIEVNFDANLFDGAVDAGFSGGRTEPTA